VQSQVTPHERPAFERGLAIARRNYLLLLLCAITVPIAALVYSLAQTPQYTASADLLFGARSFESELFGTDFDPEREAATNVKLVSVDQVAARTASTLDQPGLTTKDVSNQVTVSSEGESDLIAVDATNEDPQLATQIANEFTRQYIDFSRENEQAKIRRAKAGVQATLDNLPPSERLGPTGQNLEQQVRRLNALAAVQTGDAEVAQPATVPTSPSSPKTVRNVGLGILVGLMLGAGLALLREQLDRRLRDLDEVEDVFRIPILGTIPESDTIQEGGPGAELPPTGAESEAFRMLRTNLRYFNVDVPVTSLLITSAAPQDGKTTISWNLARAEAQAGQRVLFIEADLRRPSLTAQVDIPQESGLSLLLAGVTERNGAIVSRQGIDVLSAGPPPPNPAELIESRMMSDLLRWASEEYDRVIVDTPPSAVVSDAVPLFSQVGGVVLITRLGQSPREAAEKLRDQIDHTGALVLGIVVNGVRTPPDSDYYRASSTTPLAISAQTLERRAEGATPPEDRA